MPADIAAVHQRCESFLGRPVEWVLPVVSPVATEPIMPADAPPPANRALVLTLEFGSLAAAAAIALTTGNIVVALLVLLASGIVVMVTTRHRVGPSRFGVLAKTDVELVLLVAGIYRNYHPTACSRSYPAGTTPVVFSTDPASLVMRVMIEVADDDFAVHGWYERHVKAVATEA